MKNTQRMSILIRMAHKDQTSKYTLEKYHRHPEQVAGLVATFAHLLTSLTLEEAVCISLGHDLIEDTNITKQYLLEHFGEIIANGIDVLSHPEEGNRATRLAAANDKVHNSTSDLQLIKLCDSIVNLESIIVHDPDFARTYLYEKTALLAACDRVHPDVRERFLDTCAEVEKALGLIPITPTFWRVHYNSSAFTTMSCVITHTKADRRRMRDFQRKLRALAPLYETGFSIEMHHEQPIAATYMSLDDYIGWLDALQINRNFNLLN